MALVLKRTSPVKTRILSTLVVAFALVFQPMYGLIAGQVANAVTASVVDQAGFEAALADSTKDIIQLGANFSVDKKISISRPVVLDGAGFTLSSTRNNNPNDSSNNAVLGIDNTTGVTIQDLVVSRGAGLNLHGINIWRSTANLSSVTITGFNNGGTKYGLVVGENSQVTVQDITTSGNTRGIDVDKGTPKLTINGKSSHDESLAVVVDSGNTSYIVDTNGQYNNKFLGYWYELKAAPAVPAVTTPLQGATVAANPVVLGWSAVNGNSTTQAAVSYDYRIDGGTAENTTATTAAKLLSNGAHTLEVRAVSASGLRSNWSSVRAFTVDVDQLPVASITTPAENSFVRTKANTNKLAIAGMYTDDRSVNYLTLQLVGSTGSVALDTLHPGIGTLGGPFTHQMTVPANIADGVYHLTYTPADYNPNTGGQFGVQGQRYFTIDNTKPTVTFVAPTVALQGGSVSVQVEAADNFGLDKIVANIYKQDGSLYKSTQTSVSGALSGTHATNVTLPEGAYYIRYNASDLAGNISATADFHFTVDTTMPVVKVNLNREEYITSGTAIRSSTNPEIEATDTNLDRIELWKGGVKTGNVWTATTTSRRANIKFLSEGIYTIKGYDKAGNITEFTVIIDNTAPLASIVIPVDSSEVTTANNLEIILQASDAVGLRRFDVTLWEKGDDRSDGSTMKTSWGVLVPVDQVNNYQATFMLPADLNLPDGEYTIYFTATDLAGNSKDASNVNFTVKSEDEGEVPNEGGDDDDEVETTTPPIIPTSSQTTTDQGESPTTSGPSSLGIAAQLPIASIISGDADAQELAQGTDSADVLGEQDDESGTRLADTGEVLGLMDYKWFGIAWYWYLVILAGLIGAWLLLAAAIRRRREEEE